MFTRVAMKASAMPHCDAIFLGEDGLALDERALAELQRLTIALEMALVDLAAVCSPARRSLLERAQEAWEGFRDDEVEFAALLYEGESGAALLRMARKIELTEQRLAELRTSREEVLNMSGL